MKKIVGVLFPVLFLMSCATASFYQLYKVTPEKNIKDSGKSLVYEDDNCQVLYDFWGSGGNAGFSIYNKTDKNLYLDLGDSYFILNGIAHDYFKNRTFEVSGKSGLFSSGSVSASKSITGSNFFNLLQSDQVDASRKKGILKSSGYTVAYSEKEIVCVPAKTSKSVVEYDINETLYRDCDLLRFPNKRKIKTAKFTRVKSPFEFSNRITYRLGDSKESIHFENAFYVSAITNYPEKEMFEWEKDEFCGENTSRKKRVFKYSGADKFFVEYSKGVNQSKH